MNDKEGTDYLNNKRRIPLTDCLTLSSRFLQNHWTDYYETLFAGPSEVLDAVQESILAHSVGLVILTPETRYYRVFSILQFTIIVQVLSKVTLEDIPARFEVQLFIFMRMSDGVERGRELEGAGRARAWLALNLDFNASS